MRALVLTTQSPSARDAIRNAAPSRTTRTSRAVSSGTVTGVRSRTSRNAAHSPAVSNVVISTAAGTISVPSTGCRPG